MVLAVCDKVHIVVVASAIWVCRCLFFGEDNNYLSSMRFTIYLCCLAIAKYSHCRKISENLSNGLWWKIMPGRHLNCGSWTSQLTWMAILGLWMPMATQSRSESSDREQEELFRGWKMRFIHPRVGDVNDSSSRHEVVRKVSFYWFSRQTFI